MSISPFHRQRGRQRIDIWQNAVLMRYGYDEDQFVHDVLRLQALVQFTGKERDGKRSVYLITTMGNVRAR